MFPKVHRLSLSVQCAFTECRATNRQPAQDTGGREGGRNSLLARISSVREARVELRWWCYYVCLGQDTALDYRLKVTWWVSVTMWHVCVQSENKWHLKRTLVPSCRAWSRACLQTGDNINGWSLRYDKRTPCHCHIVTRNLNLRQSFAEIIIILNR